MLWLGAGALLFFLVPWIGTDRLGLQPDLYYLIYFTVAVVFFATFVATHATELRPLWTEHLWQSLLIGALVGAGLGRRHLRPGRHPARGWMALRLRDRLARRRSTAASMPSPSSCSPQRSPTS